MNILYLLIPLSIVLLGLIAYAFIWAVRSGQMEDLESPGEQLLLDRDDVQPKQVATDRRDGAPDQDA
jgi:cbb3-type cytochrome oxidase maturation protein